MPRRRNQTNPTPRYSRVVYHRSFDAMTPEEGREWLQGIHERLTRKMQRERVYLDRRAARGTHTPTDDAYEDDQGLEQELLSLIETLLNGSEPQGGGS